MKLNLRARMLMLALVPATTVAILLSATFVMYSIDNLEQELNTRGAAISRQVSVAADYGIFSGQREILSALTASALRIDPDVLGAAVLDRQGAVMVLSGHLHPSHVSGPVVSQGSHVEGNVMLFIEPVISHSLPVDDFYAGAGSLGTAESRTIGHVVVELSRGEVSRKSRWLLALAILLGMLAVMIGAWLALRIARSVSAPLLEAQEVVVRISNGDLAARMDMQSGGALRYLAAGINDMARRIGVTQEELQLQVAEATRDLQREKESAEHATIAKSNFLSAASHDLRQPLHALGLFVSGLSRSAAAEQEPELVGHIQEAVDTLQNLLNAILDISRLDHGNLVPEIGNFAMADVMDRLARSLSVQAQEQGLKLTLRPTQIWVRSDPRIVERILLNLVGNALRYTNAGGVLVGCRRRRDAVLVEVWDTGDGIPEHARKEIFEDYVQLGNPERDPTKGLGLGLAICRRLAASLGVPIGVRSRPGRGSVFWIELAVVQREAVDSELPVATSPIDEAIDGACLSGTVLVVEDNTLVRASMEQEIKAWGGGVLLAANRKEALRLCRESDHAPDVTICNVSLRDKASGIELAKELQREFGRMGILLVSADTSELAKSAALQAGFTLLRKPVSPGRLRAALQQLLASAASSPSLPRDRA